MSNPNGLVPEQYPSMNACMLISALVNSAEHDELLASCLIEYGVAVGLKAGIDPEQFLRHSKADTAFWIEQGMLFPADGKPSANQIN